MVFPWSLIDSKSSKVFRTLLSILAYLSKIILWIVSICPLFSQSSSPCTNPFVTEPRPISITVSFLFHSFFFSSLARSWYSYLFFLVFFQFYSVFARESNIYDSASSLFLLTIIRSGRLVVWPRLGDPFVSQNTREVNYTEHAFYHWYHHHFHVP